MERADRLRRDPVLVVVGGLARPAPVGLAEGGPHGVGDLVRVHDDLAPDVAGRPARRLDERGGRAEVALLVGVEDRDQGHLRDVEALAQQVDPDQRVELAEPEVPDHLDALEGVDVGVEVAHAEPHLEVVLGEVLGHPLGERRDQHALVPLGPRADLVHEVVDLLAGGPDRDLRGP